MAERSKVLEIRGCQGFEELGDEVRSWYGSLQLGLRLSIASTMVNANKSFIPQLISAKYNTTGL